MNVLLLGSGGREHALYWKLSQSQLLRKIYVHPGNGGFPESSLAKIAEELDPPTDDFEAQMPGEHRKLRRFIQEKGISLVVVGPEQPLVDGIVDHLSDLCSVFGPDRNGARLEGSKRFAKEFMEKYKIPTAKARSFDRVDEALRYLESRDYPIVIKADGLAAGKGVTVAMDHTTAVRAIKESLEENRFGESGNRVLIEDFLKGKEASVFALCDGQRAIPFVPARDYKRAGDNDSGPNTGGMGAFAPVPEIKPSLLEKVQTEVLNRVMEGMQQEGHPYRGLLYAGLMIDDEKVNVVEFNVRFGDPETQPLMLLLDEDLLDLMDKSAKGNLPHRPLNFHTGSAMVVVLAAEGYPDSYQKGIPLKTKTSRPDVTIFHAGTTNKDGSIVSTGGRILGVTGRQETLEKARKEIYAALEEIQVEGTFFRTDIAKGIES